MFVRAIWNKLLKYIFENNEIAGVKRGQFQNFLKSRWWFILKLSEPNMGLLVNHTKQQTLCIETIPFNSEQLQNNNVTVQCRVQSIVWLNA